MTTTNSTDTAADTRPSPQLRQWDRIIIGIDPGTNVMGYGLLGIKRGNPHLIAMGVLKLNRYDDHYMRLHRIFERVTGLIRQYLPDEMSIEAQFFVKNVQSTLKLGRAQGVAMAAALNFQVPITSMSRAKSSSRSPATAPPARSRWPPCCSASWASTRARCPSFSTPPTPLPPPCATTTRAASLPWRAAPSRGKPSSRPTLTA